MSAAARFLASGDTALVIEFGDRVDRHTSGLVIALAERLKAAAVPGVIELVPTFRSLMVHYDPFVLANAELKARLLPMLEGLAPALRSGRLWRIPACYDASVGPDIAELAGESGLSPAEIAQRHCATSYQVYMIGFLPGFPYMGDVPPELQFPRRLNPRVAVPRGSIAIATTLTAVYPLESPGGWHLIGRTPVPLWNMSHDPPTLLAAGDRVAFEPISLSQYESMLALVQAGGFELRPEQSPPGPAA